MHENSNLYYLSTLLRATHTYITNSKKYMETSTVTLMKLLILCDKCMPASHLTQHNISSCTSMLCHFPHIQCRDWPMLRVYWTNKNYPDLVHSQSSSQDNSFTSLLCALGRGHVSIWRRSVAYRRFFVLIVFRFSSQSAGFSFSFFLSLFTFGWIRFFHQLCFCIVYVKLYSFSFSSVLFTSRSWYPFDMKQIEC